MLARLIRDMGRNPTADDPSPIANRGRLIEHPKAWRLVQMGCALPVDDECKIKAGLTDEQILAAIRAQDKVALGIHPEDYDRYDRGEMLGYNPDGSDIPGPNFVPPEEADEPEAAGDDDAED